MVVFLIVWNQSLHGMKNSPLLPAALPPGTTNIALSLHAPPPKGDSCVWDTRWSADCHAPYSWQTNISLKILQLYKYGSWVRDVFDVCGGIERLSLSRPLSSATSLAVPPPRRRGRQYSEKRRGRNRRRRWAWPARRRHTFNPGVPPPHAATAVDRTVKHTAALWPTPTSSRPSSSPALPLSSFNATSYPPQCSPLSPSPSTPSIPPTDK